MELMMFLCRNTCCAIRNTCLVMAQMALIMSTILLLLPFPICHARPGTDSYQPQLLAYRDYCSHLLPDLPPALPSVKSSMPHLGFHQGLFHGGSPLFNISLLGFSFSRRYQVTLFTSQNVTLISQEGIYLVDGFLTLQNKRHPLYRTLNRTRVFKREPRLRRDPLSQTEAIRVSVKGVWAAHSGDLCMAGCFHRIPAGMIKPEEDCQMKITFKYPEQRSITNPLVKGKVKSMRKSTDPLFFESIMITAVSDEPYKYTKEDELHGVCALRQDDVPAKINVWKDDLAACQFPWYKQALDVLWHPECRGQDCSPFGLSAQASRMTLSVQKLVCEDGGKVNGLFIFSHTGKQESKPLQNEKVLAVEGVWNSGTAQLCMVACYLQGASNVSSMEEPRDCDMTVTMQFPTTVNLLFRYSVVGRVESTRPSSDSLFFKQFLFRGQMDISYGMLGWNKHPPKLEYSYTDEKLRQADVECLKDKEENGQSSKTSRRKAKFPDGSTFSDFGFHAKLQDSQSTEAWGYMSPITINDRFDRFYYPTVPQLSASPLFKKRRKMNVSFDLIFDLGLIGIELGQNTSSSRLSAEGLYYSRTGRLCLIACRTMEPSAQHAKLLDGGDKDCQILIRVEYPPTNPGYFDQQLLQGKIISLRNSSDPLYFRPISLSSKLHMYREQAFETILQMDIEIIMGIISLSMASVFIGLQLLHVKRHPSVLTNMSLLMLSILTLGHLIPLVLNFEAIFSNRSRQNVLQWSGGWLEVNEVVVRLMTMVVFLLLLRLLQLAWVSKGASTTKEGPWFREQKILYVCLTLYLLGGVTAFIFHWHLGGDHGRRGGLFLKRMKAYAGFTVDFFLLPQLIGNCVWGVEGTVLSPPFYLGMTLVRSLPHVYDTVRNIKFSPHQNNRYYYANPNWDFYSNAWDVIIPCGAVVLAALIFLQQRYGGSCLIPHRWRHIFHYEKVSTVAT